MRFMTLARRAILVALVASTAAMEPYAAARRWARPVQQQQSAAAEGNSAPMPIGEPGPDGWSTRKKRSTKSATSNGTSFTVKDTGTAYVYVGDQWYNLNLGLFSVKHKQDVGCWSVDVRGTSTEAERRISSSCGPDERAIEVEEGDYWLTVRAGDAGGFDPSRTFTVRVAVGPRVCALAPANVPDPNTRA